ncbi:MAG: zinc-ribbon domain-containing protein [Chloroflexi bacterium]|nr:MAG: zinc-ribbon domain-containing protein [Chloroflexota bacterium]
MIIFGANTRYKTLRKGHFYCPNCMTERPYELKEARPYFTLYFLPLFPIGKPREVVQCAHCQMVFDTTVLNMEKPKRPLSLAEILNRLDDLLASGTPIEYLVRDMTAAGLEREVALRAIRDVIGDARVECPDCHLSYAPDVTACSVCGHSLEHHAD